MSSVDELVLADMVRLPGQETETNGCMQLPGRELSPMVTYKFRLYLRDSVKV